MTLWVARIVFTSALGREEKQLLVGLTQPKAGSWRHLYIYLSRSTCRLGLKVRLSSAPTRGSCCPAIATRARSSNPNPNPHSTDDPICSGKGRVEIQHFPPWGGAPSLTHCHQPLLTAHSLPFWRKSEVSICAFLTTHRTSSSWQLKQKASVCIDLVISLLLSVLNLLKYFLVHLFKASTESKGSHL